MNRKKADYKLTNFVIVFALAVISVILTRASGKFADALSSSFGFITDAYGPVMLRSLAQTLIGCAFPATAALLLFRKKYRRRKKASYSFSECFVSGLAICGILSLVISLLPGGASEIAVSGGGMGMIYGIAVYALIVPFSEELLFRKAILGLLPDSYWPSIVLSAALFALAHPFGLGMLYAFAAGIVLGAAVRLCGSISASFAIHSANNLMALIVRFSDEISSDAPLIAVRIAFAASVVGAVIIIFGRVKKKSYGRK